MTNRDGDPVDLDVDHRAHAVVELAIRDLKHDAGLTHCPSGMFNANAAWLVATMLAHNVDGPDDVHPDLADALVVLRRMLASLVCPVSGSATLSRRFDTRLMV